MYENILELRRRIITIMIFLVAMFIVCYCYIEQINSFLALPLNKISNTRQQFIYTSLTEAFTSYVQIALYSAICLTMPVIMWNIYMFAAPGLYKHEKKIMIFYFLSSPALFLMGAFIAYNYIMPKAWLFFTNFESSMPELSVTLLPKINDYLSLAISIMLAFGIAFQLPLILTFLTQINVISADTLSKQRKKSIVIIFAVAAVLTPPDVLSQIGLAIPLMILYEISIMCCRYVPKIQTHKANLTKA